MPFFCRFISGWTGGIFLFLLCAGVGVAVKEYFPLESGYNLSIDFMSLRKLEFSVKSSGEYSALSMDVSELNAKLDTSKSVIAIKISSIPEPYSDVGKNKLSFFITSESDSSPTLLLSPTSAAKSYVDFTTQLSIQSGARVGPAQIILLKTNGVNAQPYYKIDLPSSEDLDSILLSEALTDSEFLAQQPQWKKTIEDQLIPDIDRLINEILVYYFRDHDGSLHISHFLLTSLREYYE